MCFDFFAGSCTLNQTRIAWKSLDAKADEFHEFRPGERQSQYICTKTGSSCCRRESSHLGRSSKWTGKRHGGCRAVRRGKRQAKREAERVNELSLSRASCKHFTRVQKHTHAIYACNRHARNWVISKSPSPFLLHFASWLIHVHTDK